MLSPSVAAPPHPTPPETIAEALDHIGPLHGMPFEIASGSRVTATSASPTPATSYLKRAHPPNT